MTKENIFNKCGKKALEVSSHAFKSVKNAVSTNYHLAIFGLYCITCGVIAYLACKDRPKSSGKENSKKDNN